MLAPEVVAELRVGVALEDTTLGLVPQIRGATEETAAMDMAARQEPMAAQLAEVFTPDAPHIILTHPTSVGPTTPRAAAGGAALENMAAVAGVTITIMAITVEPAAAAEAI